MATHVIKRQHALGIQEKFSWGQVATSAIGAGVGYGVDQWAQVNGSALSALDGPGFRETVGQSLVGNVATQSIAVASGLQEHFSWTSVAAAGIGAGVAWGAGDLIGRAQASLDVRNSFSGNVVRGTLTGLVSGGAQAALTGERPNWGLIAAESFGNSLGSAAANAAKAADQKRRQDEAAQQANLFSRGRGSFALNSDTANMSYVEDGLFSPSFMGRDGGFDVGGAIAYGTGLPANIEASTTSVEEYVASDSPASSPEELTYADLVFADAVQEMTSNVDVYDYKPTRRNATDRTLADMKRKIGTIASGGSGIPGSEYGISDAGFNFVDDSLTWDDVSRALFPNITRFGEEYSGGTFLSNLGGYVQNNINVGLDFLKSMNPYAPAMDLLGVPDFRFSIQSDELAGAAISEGLNWLAGGLVGFESKLGPKAASIADNLLVSNSASSPIKLSELRSLKEMGISQSGRRAVVEGYDLGLGLTRTDGQWALRDFARNQDARIYYSYGADNVNLFNSPMPATDEILSSNIEFLMEKSNNIKFNLDGVVKSVDDIPSMVELGSQGIGTRVMYRGEEIGNHTNWELYKIMDDDSFFNKTNFYLNGQKIDVSR